MKNSYILSTILFLLSSSAFAKTPDFAECHLEDQFHEITMSERADFKGNEAEVTAVSSSLRNNLDFKYTFKVRVHTAEEHKSGMYYRGYIEATDGRSDASTMSSEVHGDTFDLMIGYKGKMDRFVICKVYWK